MEQQEERRDWQQTGLELARLRALGQAQARAAEPGPALPVAQEDRREQMQQFLRRYRQAVAQAEDLAGEARALRALEDRMVDTLPGRCPAMVRLEQLACRLEAQLERCLDIRAQVERAIQAVGDEQQRRILQLRYIRGLTWEKIGRALMLDERWVRRLHTKALDWLILNLPPL